MQRITASFPVTNKEVFKQQMLRWANQSSVCCFLDNNSYSDKHNSYEWLLAAGAVKTISPTENKLEALKEFCAEYHDWLFGHFGYDLKNEIEDLYSSHTDFIGFPDVFLFQPEIVIGSNEDTVSISSLAAEPSAIYNAICEVHLYTADRLPQPDIQLRTVKWQYIDTVEKLRNHILRGDCYEVNYCIEFFAEDALIDPLFVYEQLVKISPNPFASFYKLHDKYLLCASPERYLKKTGNNIISQPIKGTIKRNQEKEQDENNKQQLLHSNKDRSENVMVVDLVRNDLSKVCKDGSVTVEELFGIYSFPQVHQMISTVKGQLKEDIGIADIINATFPMGSMTGAPKKRVMELIEQYEQTKRGIFSGAVGYIDPEGDFDFNVVIRSIMYNEANNYLSYQVGSAITFYSNAADEFEECLLKSKAIEQVLC
ncbi:MAG: anthranilate synthase component I family protein [Panacibacter sp.]